VHTSGALLPQHALWPADGHLSHRVLMLLGGSLCLAHLVCVGDCQPCSYSHLIGSSWVMRPYGSSGLAHVVCVGKCSMRIPVVIVYRSRACASPSASYFSVGQAHLVGLGK